MTTKRMSFALGICAAIMAVNVEAARAQFGAGGVGGYGLGNRGIGNRPTFSPYLNLTRGGATAAQNYFGLVRPEMEFRNAYRGLEREIATGNLAITQQADPQTGIPYTGHSAVFLNTGNYFLPSSGGGQIGAGRGRGPVGAGVGRAGGAAPGRAGGVGRAGAGAGGIGAAMPRR